MVNVLGSVVLVEFVSGPYRTISVVAAGEVSADEPAALAAIPANCGVETAGFMPSGIVRKTATAAALVVAPPPVMETVGGDV